MKIVNIDRFKDTISIELNTKSYSVKTLTVKEYINGDIIDSLENARKTEGLKGYAARAVDILKTRSDMPEEILEELGLTQLEAMLLAMQGVDINALPIFSEGDAEGK